MDGVVRQSSRRAHPFFALVSLSFFSLIALFSRPAVLLHHVHYSRRDLQPFPRADEDPPLTTTLPSNDTAPFAAPGVTSSLSPGTSTPSPSSISSTSLSTTTITSSSSSTTSISTRTDSTPRPPPTLSQSYISTPTTTTLTSSTPSTPASSSTTTYSVISDVTPSTTFDIGVDDPSTSTTVVSSVDSSSTGTSSSGTTSSSTKFWDNKGAVVATFLFTSLLCLAFVIMIIMMILKRRKARVEALIDSEFMPYYQEPNSPVASLTPSISTSPLDPFRSRDVVHDHLPADIPTSKPTNSHGRDIPTIQLTPPSAFLGTSRYLLPSQLQATPTTINVAGQRSKSEMRVSTQSGYQPSFDSFYGAYD